MLKITPSMLLLCSFNILNFHSILKCNYHTKNSFLHSLDSESFHRALISHNLFQLTGTRNSFSRGSPFMCSHSIFFCLSLFYLKSLKTTQKVCFSLHAASSWEHKTNFSFLSKLPSSCVGGNFNFPRLLLIQLN